jgi:hypothetical protein
LRCLVLRTLHRKLSLGLGALVLNPLLASVLLPRIFVERYSSRTPLLLLYRADAAFAKPEVY